MVIWRELGGSRAGYGQVMVDSCERGDDNLEVHKMRGITWLAAND